MRLVILGKGKTGTLVAEVARERGHQVTTTASAENENGIALTPDKLAGVDAVIDFTAPEAVIHNITACAHAKTSMVVGTTGWYQHLAKVRELVELSGIGFVYGANFSVGVNIFFETVRAAAAALPLGYSARIMERHHTQKKDSPSGTAITIQKLMGDATGVSEPVEIISIREGDVVGTHAVLLDSENDTMMLTHDAKSRRGFADGAVRAAEWIAGRHGFYEFKDIFHDIG
jgi:4-hydroxy-tetrahydrodipicolinate reductase